MNDVKVHYNSDKPAQLQAHAYAQGTDIHLAAGQEKHLPHEAWHVVQQKQGRVKPTLQMKGKVNVNDDKGLEREADVMGAKAVQMKSSSPQLNKKESLTTSKVHQAKSENPIQRFEAPLHQSAEMYALTHDHKGGKSANGLTEEEASSVYFGNWMRDINQGFVPMIDNAIGNDVTFAIINFMAAKKFGRLITSEMLGYYIPAEHLDNPGGLVTNDDILGGPPNISPEMSVGPQKSTKRPAIYDTKQQDVSPKAKAIDNNFAELFNIDQTGTAAYIRRSNIHVEKRLELAANTGRNPEGMMHFGAGLHTVEDLFAHGNWIEIAVEKALRDNPNLLPKPKDGKKLDIFNYSREVTIKGEKRPPLVTGTFTGADSMISLASELDNFLRAGLKAGPEGGSPESEAQDRLVRALLVKYSSELENPKVKEKLYDELFGQKQSTLRSVAEANIGSGSILFIYDNSEMISKALQLFNVIAKDIKDYIRGLVNGKLREIANVLRAEAINTGIADTNLISVMREEKKIANMKNNSPASPMEQFIEESQGISVKDQRAAAAPGARRRVNNIQQAPKDVLAGPSHSQLAKDHTNSPFFGLSFTMATHAVRRLREKMMIAWNDKTPHNFERGNFPEGTDEKEKDLYHSNRKQRNIDVNSENLKRGKAIVEKGGDVNSKGQFEPFSLEGMRNEAANHVNTTAFVLQNITKPATILQLGKFIPKETQNSLNDKIQAELSKQPAGAKEIKKLEDLGKELKKIGDSIRIASTHKERETLNKALVTLRKNTLHALIYGEQAKLHSNMKFLILASLDTSINTTAVSYTGEQREILESNSDILGTEHDGSQYLSLKTIDLPSLSNKKPAIQNLIKESRMILNHPYESNWWKGYVEEYIRNNKEQIMADIQARNAGYAFFTRPGEQHKGHGH